jgi:peptide/nickel transport system permease protein
MPGDPVKLALGSEKAADPEVVAQMRSNLGLDKPISIQYADFLKGLLKGDFGISITDQTPVIDNIKIRLPQTIELAIISIILASIIGIIIGLIAAYRRNSLLDTSMTALSAVGISLPVFVLGTLLIIIFSLRLKLLPSSGFSSFFRSPGDHIRHLILPAVTLALGLAASIARMTRSSMLEVQGRDFVQTLRAKGLPESKVIFKHAFRNALIPIVTVIGLQLGNLIGGVVIIEYLFNWPGISTLLMKSISFRDYPTIQGCVLLISVFYIVINMIIDMLYGLLDPRIR